MKKIVLLMLCGIFIFGVVGCVNNNNKQKEEDNSVNKNKVNIGDENKMYIKINDTALIVTLENNSSVEALIQKLKEKDITVDMEEYGGFEKVGSLGFSLPTSDKQITTKPGDIVLYQGDKLTIHYGKNSWSYTKIGKIENINQTDLNDILGSGDITITLTLHN